MPTIEDYLNNNEERIERLAVNSPLDSISLSKKTGVPNRRRRPWLEASEPSSQTAEINTQSVRVSNTQEIDNSNTLSNRQPNMEFHAELHVESNRQPNMLKEAPLESFGVPLLDFLNRDDLNALAVLCHFRTSESTTRPLTYHDLAKPLRIVAATLRDRIRKLRKLGFITAQYVKLSRGGANIYHMNVAAISEVMAIPATNYDSNRQPNTLSNTEANRLGVSCSSNNIFNTTTNTSYSDGANRQPNTLSNTEANRLGTVVDRLKSDLIFESWNGLDPASLTKYVYRKEGGWIRPLSELQDILDKAAAAVEFQNKKGTPIRNPLGFLHSCLGGWSVDVPPGYKSRDEKEKEGRELKFRKERDAFFEKHQLQKNSEINSIIEKLCESYLNRSNIGWNKTVEGTKTEFLNELYVNTMGYNQGIIDLLGGSPFRNQLKVKETIESLGLENFLEKTARSG